MTYIPSPQRTGNKICGDFYPLQKEELIALYKAKLINNTAFVHFALRYENPFCDRPITLIIKEFAIKWGIPENSLYQALAKLNKSGGFLHKPSKRGIMNFMTEMMQILQE